MKVNYEEKRMYEVMNAIYGSGIPIDFKGAMVLRACLMENGFVGSVRHTMDIDANWISDTAPTPEQLVQSLQQALDQHDIPLTVRLFRMYGTGRSAGFEFCDSTSEMPLFTMDMDVNRPAAETRLYNVEGIVFRGVVPTQMLADKIVAVSSEKVFRRIKDVVDLYYLSQCFQLDPIKVKNTIQKSGREIGPFSGLKNHKDMLSHAYEKFRFGGSVEKPTFDEVYEQVCAYLKDFIQC